MTVTALGGFLLPLSLFVFLFKRAWLLPLFCVAAVLQSASALDVAWRGQAFGVTPFLAVSALILIDLVLRIRREGPICIDAGPQRLLIRWWLAFAAVSLLSAIVLPWVFSGSAIISPLEKGGAFAPPVSLAWSISNVAQMLNLALIVVALLWIAQQRKDPHLPRRMLLGVVVAVVLSAMIGLLQRLGWNGVLPLWEGFWASNPTYAQTYKTWAGPVPRVSWPLVDPSYGSAWYAAVLGGFVAMFLADARRHWALLAALVAASALANSLGATGLLATALYLLLLVWVVVLEALRVPALRGGLTYRLCMAAIVCACVGLACYLVLRHYALFDLAERAIGNVLQGRSQTVLGDIRPDADKQALALLRDTWGLGVGMGSNRASSYLSTLASNTGVLGLTLFLGAVGYQFRLLIAQLRQQPNAPAIFFLGSGMAGLIAVAIAIPDQNWPAFWVLILGGVACLGAEGESRGETTESSY